MQMKVDQIALQYRFMLIGRFVTERNCCLITAEVIGVAVRTLMAGIIAMNRTIELLN